MNKLVDKFAAEDQKISHLCTEGVLGALQPPPETPAIGKR